MDNAPLSPDTRFEPSEPPSPTVPTSAATNPAPSTCEPADEPAADTAGGLPEIAPALQTSSAPGCESESSDSHQHARVAARTRRKTGQDVEPSNHSPVRRRRNGPRLASSHTLVFVDVALSRLAEPAQEVQVVPWRAPTGSGGLGKRTRHNLEARFIARPILALGDPSGPGLLEVVANGEDLPDLRAQLGHDAIVPVVVIGRRLPSAKREEIALQSMLAHALTAPARKGLARAIEQAVERLQQIGSPPLLDCRKMPLARAFDLDHRSFSGESEHRQTVTVPQFPVHRSSGKRLPN